MDAMDIANFLAQELLLHQLVSLDGLHSGVPTRTTPTLTPTTLRNIEQTFIELQCESVEHVSQAGFVPPPASIPQAADFSSYLDISRSSTVDLDRSNMSSSSSWQSPPPPELQHNPQPSRRNMGGRRPNKPTNISPEEEERRVVRRERNKMAAARCRKRRMDHTNELVEETEQLEAKKQTLQNEIQQLKHEREELEFLLETHRAYCRRQGTIGSRPNSPPDIKPFTTLLAASEGPLVKPEPDEEPPSPKRIMLSNANPDVLQPITTNSTNINGGNIITVTSNIATVQKPSRPCFLNVPMSLTPAQSLNLKQNNGLSMTEIAGIQITTPSTGIPFNFDSLMDGGTGLTPVSAPLTPRNAHLDQNGSLETPTHNKLVSL